MIIPYVVLAAGLVILVKGADWMVGAATKIAERLKVPSFIIGLFIVSIGTSAPEAAVGIKSGLDGSNLLTLGAVLGSNITNITLILGVTALIYGIRVGSRVPKRELLLLLGIQIVLFGMILTGRSLSRAESIILLAGMLLFSGFILSKARQTAAKEKPNSEFEEDVMEFMEDQDVVAEGYLELLDGKERQISMPKQSFLFILGLAGLIIGADLAVDSAVEIAQSFAWSEEFIGLTVLALGTSLPELVASLIAAKKGEEDIALGNIIGSNILNIFFVLGLSGTLHPISVSGTGVFFDLLVMIAVTIFLIIPTFLYRKISRRTGVLFLACYIVYLFIKILALP